MMYSDISIASILSGDKNAFQTFSKEVGAFKIKKEPEKINSSADTIQQYYWVYLKEDNEKTWEIFKRTYIQYIRKHPKEMVLGKMISIIQFYTNFHTPDFVKYQISTLCPHAHLSKESWNIRPDKLHNTGGNYEKIYLFSAALIFLIILFFYRKNLDNDMRFFIFVSLIGFTYSFSYWPVTPTPDARYHSLPVMTQCLFLSYLAARGCLFCWHYFRNKDPHPHTEN